MSRLLAAAIAIFCLLPPSGPAAASQQGERVIKNWKRMDACARAAQAAHPDYTAAANRARDEALKTCLESGNLPPRSPSSAR
jgi:hypothetical protein